ncbi:Isoquinoline 1-oxidoreductase subunit alpha [Zhongshania aliphaticivorans]|uniref:Isoquinoline 1-oxidoreductase subunit alpha n=1 Tax=Zhongshania aliphaticivorans TaxID=1470434 RepID=A0A5S9NUS8_9GAMM|nr:(2Fe-2S)-binding protein [Zhongshania aliphaticivorans]CAA0088486.1 Isoquinoline 1-oxidoreductase subunit alpha [Zhongshania aliphaticivorans]CAA0094485.1 Isoquinoline 1-oxidoreductase subunit alpha [Zhongshania aliphaticivorans]
MAELNFTVNGQAQALTVDAGTPLLWVLREQLAMTGTKFGCGMGLCGACTVHVDGNPVRSCSYPVEFIDGKSVTTIEGLAESDDALHPVQQAWLEMNVPQCGYCQSGQIMSAVALLASNQAPSDEQIDAAMSGNICRCGTYPRIRKAIHRASELTVQYYQPNKTSEVAS